VSHEYQHLGESHYRVSILNSWLCMHVVGCRYFGLFLYLFSVVNLLVPTDFGCRGLELHVITHVDTHTHTHTLGRILWTTDRPVAENSTCKNTQYLKETDIHASDRFRTRSPSKRAVTDLMPQTAPTLESASYGRCHINTKSSVRIIGL
jgi:hypothetical protein